MISRRTQIVLLVVVISAAFGLSALWQALTARAELTLNQSQRAPQGQSQASSARARALTVLAAWDKQRAAAYAQGDVKALSRLYVEGSKTGAQDRLLLKAYVARGLRVEEMSTQILGVEIVNHTEGSLVLMVTDRLSSAVAVGKGIRQVLPRDEANTRQIQLTRIDGRWLVLEVDSEDGDQPRPVESTSRTPAS